METSMENFGTLEYVLDKYSKTWSWKLKGQRAVSMISKLVPEAWYGENIDEVIIPVNILSIQAYGPEMASVDNIIFITIVTNKLPEEQQEKETRVIVKICPKKVTTNAIFA